MVNQDVHPNTDDELTLETQGRLVQTKCVKLKAVMYKEKQDAVKVHS